MISGIKSFAEKVNAPFDRLAERLAIKNRKLAALFKFSVFFIALHLILQTVGVYKFIHLRPASVHASAQAQRASVALNYYKSDMNFFEPRIQRNVKGEGITGLEFPIIYYTAAVMYKMFGFNEAFLRIINLLIVVYGLFLFYRLGLEYIKNSFLTIMLLGSAFLSPVLLFYTPNFLPDAPSMGLVLASWYFFFRYMKTARKRDLVFFVLTATLASLIKSVAAMCFVVVICLMLLDKLKFFKKQAENGLIPSKGKLLLGIIAGFLCVFLWYYYAHYITIKYANQSFALTPIMVDSWDSLMKVWEYIRNYWGLQYFSYETYVLIVCSIITIILSARFVNRLLLTITVLYVFGCMAYVFFFTNQFQNHDYYIIAILPAVFFLFLTFGDIVYRLISQYFRPLAIVITVIVFFNMKEAIGACKINYFDRNLYAREYLSHIDFRPFDDLEPVLRAKGIKRTDRFVTAFDHTYCSTLYLMDQLGTVINEENSGPETDSILKIKELKYLIVNDSAALQRKLQRNLEYKIIGYHRGLIIYKLR